jgi:deoxyribodipyrimidine photolyase
LERKAWVASFGRPKMSPQSLLASQTGLSPYLRFGCLSTRLFYYQLTDLYKKIKRTCPPLSLHGQLLWYNSLAYYFFVNLVKFKNNLFSGENSFTVAPLRTLILIK